MRTIAAAAMMGAALLAPLGLAGQAEAKGCIRGAIVGGIAGHFAGHHGLMGAAAGCAVGHHYAHRRSSAQPTSDQTQTAPAAQ